MHTIQLKHGNSYLQVQPESTQVTTTSDGTTPWTHFAVHQGDSTLPPKEVPLENRNHISLRAPTGSYLQAAGGGGSHVAATGERNQGWQTFVIEKPSLGAPIHSGDQVYLRTLNGQYLAISGNTLVAKTPNPGEATFFTVNIVAQIRPLNMVVLGDSVAWGQGLKESDKYDTQVERWLEQRLKRPIHRYRMAHSGATVERDSKEVDHYDGDTAPLFPGELPYSNPAIRSQATNAKNRLQALHGLDGKAVDFVLMNGGINTVNLRECLLNPLAGVEAVTRKTQEAGRQLRDTVREVLECFPRAKVILTDYYPIISSDSPVWVLDVMVAVVGPAFLSLPAIVGSQLLLEILTRQCRAFHTEMTRQMGSIAEAYSDRVALAKSGFGEEHALGTQESLLWGVGLDFKSAVDSVFEERLKTWADNKFDPPHGAIASVGHPNRAGARRYAESVCRTVERWCPEWEGTLITVDGLHSRTKVRGTVTLTGWALGGTASARPESSQVELYLDGPAGTGTFLGTATSGVSRPEVAAQFGERFSKSGWSFTWDTTKVPEGAHTLHVRARSDASEAWRVYKTSAFTVTQVPYPHDPFVAITSPIPRRPGARRELPTKLFDLEPPFESPKDRSPSPDEGAALPEDFIPPVRDTVTLRGWAADRRALTGTGIDKVHVYLDGPAQKGQFLGEATYGGSGPDRAHILGASSFQNCEWHLDWNSRQTSVGIHRLYVYAHSTVSDRWISTSMDVSVTESDFIAEPLVTVDQPARNTVVKGTITMEGWALDRSAREGTGVDQIHVYLDGPLGKGVFLGAATCGVSRPDVGTHFGNGRFNSAGWKLSWNTSEASPGDHTLHVYAYSTAKQGWCLRATQPVRI